jgi:hypothetical protein
VVGVLIAAVLDEQGGTVLGVPVPDGRPMFLTVVGVHIAAGLVAVLAGAIAALARKRGGVHPAVGRTYLVALGVVTTTAATLVVLRWPHDLRLFVLGALAAGAAGYGWRARRAGLRVRPRWRRGHVVGMGSSYVLMLTAFYVDNGPRLPVWELLPPPVFWVLPAAIGAPVIVWALARHGLLAGGRAGRAPTTPPSPTTATGSG